MKTFINRRIRISSMVKPEYHDDLIAIYTAFRDKVYPAKSVLHPSCASDASPSKVFDNVTYVDIEDGCEGAMAAFRKHGLKAYKMDIRDYKPEEEHDLLILLNPSIPTEWAAQHLKKGSFILANNYHGNATQMHKEPEYTLWGVIDFVEPDGRKNDIRVTFSRDLTDLFVPVKNEEELRRLRPHEHRFITECYPDLLRTSGITPAETFEEMYFQYSRMMHKPAVLPVKRVADRYIFVKK